MESFEQLMARDAPATIVSMVRDTLDDTAKTIWAAHLTARGIFKPPPFVRLQVWWTFGRKRPSLAQREVFWRTYFARDPSTRDLTIQQMMKWVTHDTPLFDPSELLAIKDAAFSANAEAL